ncbi:unnamed protein product [Rhizoctonia solani]|uniref:Uncharacterized protein n=1 Tax=Rhizoctonia solani TaxID=456999 RepID=A0A8H3APD5_9AGAM|nr:unnamed protein product [Rhizoctonia solani]
MPGPHRVKKRTTVKLHGLKYPYNSSFAESDPISQDTLTPTHTLSLSAAEARNATSRRLVSQEYSKLSAHDRAALNDWVEEPMRNNETIDDMDIVDIPDDMSGSMGKNESESIFHSIIPPNARYRSWTERTHNASAAWSNQYEDLADAYLHFNASSPNNREPPTSVLVDEEGSEETETFIVEAVDIFARYSEVSITHSCAGGRNTALCGSAIDSNYVNHSCFNIEQTQYLRSTSNRATTTAATPIMIIKKRSARAIHRTHLHEKRQALNSKLALARRRFESEVDQLGKEYHKSAREIKTRALLRNKHGIVKRKVNTYNAYRHMQSKARKTAAATSSFAAAQELDAVAYRDADPEDIAKACDKFAEEKERRSGYVHKTLKGRVQHSDKVIRGIDQAIKELSFSCGVESLCIFVNGSNRDHSLLQAAYTPKGLEFLEGPLKRNLNNLLQDFQTFAQGGTEDMAKSHRELQKQLRDQVSARLLASLQDAAAPKNSIRTMKYEDYEQRICQKYKVVLVGWPAELGKFRSPTNIGNKQLKMLLDLLKDKSCRFEKAPAE